MAAQAYQYGCKRRDQLGWQKSKQFESPKWIQVFIISLHNGKVYIYKRISEKLARSRINHTEFAFSRAQNARANRFCKSQNDRRARSGFGCIYEGIAFQNAR